MRFITISLFILTLLLVSGCSFSGGEFFSASDNFDDEYSYGEYPPYYVDDYENDTRRDNRSQKDNRIDNQRQRRHEDNRGNPRKNTTEPRSASRDRQSRQDNNSTR